MAQIFPSFSTPKAAERALNFDPAAECVVSGQQKKIKAAIKPKQRVVNISVVMMKKYSSCLPKGKERHSLAANGRILNMKVTRGMSAREVKDKIRAVFDVAKSSLAVPLCLLMFLMSEHNSSKKRSHPERSVSAIMQKECMYVCMYVLLYIYMHYVCT